MRRIHLLVAISLFFAGLTWPGSSPDAWGDPCPQPQQSNAPLSRQNQQTVSTAQQAAASAGARKLPWYRITIQGELNTGVQKLSLTNFVALDSAAISDPNNPNHNQAIADLSSAMDTFLFATDQTNCPQPFGHTGACGPKTFDEYKAYLATNQNLDFNAKVELLSMLGNKLSTLFSDSTGLGETPLPAVFQALITGAKTAGQCRDIHEFIAVSAASLGLKNAGTTSADWDNGSRTVAHVIAQFQDPQTRKYVFVNYGDVYGSNSRYVTEASQQMAAGLNRYTSATQIETESGNGTPTLHEMQGPATQAIQNTIDQGSDMSQPHLQISVGNEQSSASLQTKVIGGAHNRIGVFAVGAENTEGDPLQMGAGGVRADLGATKRTSATTKINVKGNVKVGVLDVDGQGVSGVSGPQRNELATFTSGQAEADFAWKESKATSGNSGHVGIQVQAQDATYVNAWFASGNIPFDTVNVIAVDNPKPGLQLHFTDSGFIANRTAQDTSTAYHHVDDAMGAKVTGKLGKKITASNDVTVHDFNGQAYGVHDDAGLAIRTVRRGTFSLGTDVGYVKNNSSDDFYDYPLTCGIEANYEKKLGRVTVDASGRFNCNKHNDYTLMQGDSPLSSPGWTLTQPKAAGGFKISW